MVKKPINSNTKLPEYGGNIRRNQLYGYGNKSAGNKHYDEFAKRNMRPHGKVTIQHYPVGKRKYMVNGTQRTNSRPQCVAEYTQLLQRPIVCGSEAKRKYSADKKYNWGVEFPQREKDHCASKNHDSEKCKKQIENRQQIIDKKERNGKYERQRQEITNKKNKMNYVSSVNFAARNFQNVKYKQKYEKKDFVKPANHLVPGLASNEFKTLINKTKKVNKEEKTPFWGDEFREEKKEKRKKKKRIRFIKNDREKAKKQIMDGNQSVRTKRSNQQDEYMLFDKVPSVFGSLKDLNFGQNWSDNKSKSQRSNRTNNINTDKKSNAALDEILIRGYKEPDKKQFFDDLLG